MPRLGPSTNVPLLSINKFVGLIIPTLPWPSIIWHF